MTAKRAAAPARLIPACWTWPEPGRTELQKSATDEYSQRLAMWAWHEGCAICGRVGLRQVEDHDHETGFTRGWLCDECNVREGYRWGGVYAMYRECNPAVIFGFSARYVDRVTGLAAEPRPVLTEEEQERRFEATRVALEEAFGAESAA